MICEWYLEYTCASYQGAVWYSTVTSIMHWNRIENDFKLTVVCLANDSHLGRRFITCRVWPTRLRWTEQRGWSFAHEWKSKTQPVRPCAVPEECGKSTKKTNDWPGDNGAFARRGQLSAKERRSDTWRYKLSPQTRLVASCFIFNETTIDCWTAQEEQRRERNRSTNVVERLISKVSKERMTCGSALREQVVLWNAVQYFPAWYVVEIIVIYPAERNKSTSSSAFYHCNHLRNSSDRIDWWISLSLG